MAALRVICVSLSVVFGFVGIVRFSLVVADMLAGLPVINWRALLPGLGPPLALLVLSAAGFALLFRVLAPRSVAARAVETADAPLAVCTMLGGLAGVGASAALVLIWDLPHWSGLPVALAFILAGGALGIIRQKPPRVDFTRCLECGYDLRGSPGPRCPECGTAFDPEVVRTAAGESDSPEMR